MTYARNAGGQPICGQGLKQGGCRTAWAHDRRRSGCAHTEVVRSALVDGLVAIRTSLTQALRIGVRDWHAAGGVEVVVDVPRPLESVLDAMPAEDVLQVRAGLVTVAIAVLK